MHQPFTLMQYNKLPQKEDCKFIEVDTIYFLQIKGYKVQNENTQEELEQLYASKFSQVLFSIIR